MILGTDKKWDSGAFYAYQIFEYNFGNQKAHLSVK